MGKIKYISISIDEAEEMMLNNQYVIIADRYRQEFYLPSELSVDEWFEIKKSNNEDNRYDFYCEVKENEMLS